MSASVANDRCHIISGHQTIQDLVPGFRPKGKDEEETVRKRKAAPPASLFPVCNPKMISMSARDPSDRIVRRIL